MSGFSLERLVDLLRERAISPGAPIEVQRRDHDRAVAKAPVADGVELKRVQSNGGPLEWLIPSGRSRPEVLLWFHGGGFGIGSSATARGMVSYLAAMTGARGATLEYRLAPEHPYPAAVEDAQAAYRWLLVEQGVEPTKLVVGGDSAGGALALATLVRLRDAGDPMRAGALCFSPWVDLSLSVWPKGERRDRPATDPCGLEGMAARYLGGVDPRSPHVSPLFGDLAGLPPLLIQVGGVEALLDDSVRLARAAADAGCEVVFEQWRNMIQYGKRLPPASRTGLRRSNVRRTGSPSVGESSPAHTAQVTLRCARAFTSLRWTFGRYRDGPYVSLVDQTDGAPDHHSRRPSQLARGGADCGEHCVS
jgi:acetyl esterase/lipase